MATEKSNKDLNSHVRADEDEQNMHFPKLFLSANKGQISWKDETENLEWRQLTVFPPVIDIVDGAVAPPTENNGDTYVITVTTILDTNTIAFQSGNTIRHTFNGSPDLSVVAVNDHLRIIDAGKVSNNGTFKITAVNNTLGFIEVTNPNRSDSTDDEASDSPATGTTVDAGWDQTGDGDWVEFDGADDVWSGVTLDTGASFFNEAADELTTNTSSGFVSTANQWLKISKTFADFSIAGLEKDIEVLSLPAGHELVKLLVKQDEAFTGTGITKCETELGIAGELSKYMFEAFDVFQAAGDTVFFQETVDTVETFGGTTSIRGNMRSVGADLDQLSAGKIDYFLYVEEIPI